MFFGKVSLSFKNYVKQDLFEDTQVVWCNLFLLYYLGDSRFCKKNFLEKPTPGERTDSFGQLNPAFQAFPLERRETIQADEESSADQEPVYSVIPDNENQNNDFNNRHYQLMNNVNRQSEASTYARINYFVDL